MKVCDLVEFLLKQPQDIEVAYCCYSEADLLEEDQIGIVSGCLARPDGWIQNERPDMEQQEYLMFPGN